MSISDLSSGALYREDERAYQEDILSKSHFLGEYVLTTWQPIAALHAFIRTAAGRSGFESGAPRVDRLVAHPDDADPGHDHQSLHSHHTPCAVIGSYKPCRHSIVEVNFTITAADEPILVR